MKAIEIAASGGPEQLRLVDRPTPAPGPDEVLIRVAAAGVNRADLLQRQGHYPPPPGASDLPGLEVAGTVVAVGPTLTGSRWRRGDRVCALLSGGGYADHVAVPAVQCLPVPADLTLVEAACLPETCLTVWTNVFDRGRLTAGEVLLVHGGTSGIGTTAIQIARARGATVLATAGSDVKCAACERLGATRAINYRTEDFVEGVRSATSGRGADVILDIVGGDYTPRNLEALAVEGRLVQIALLGGARDVRGPGIGDAQAAHRHRLDASVADSGREGCHRPGRRDARLAAHHEGRPSAGHRGQSALGRCRTGAPDPRGGPAHRQGRTGGGRDPMRVAGSPRRDFAARRSNTSGAGRTRRVAVSRRSAEQLSDRAHHAPGRAAATEQRSQQTQQASLG